MKIFSKKPKKTPNFGYWGEYGEIELGLSSGLISDKTSFSSEQLHYHVNGIVYFIIHEGEGVLEVNGKEIPLKRDDMCEVKPGEQYRILRAEKTPFSWLAVCTSNNADDKIIVNEKRQ
jgi:mannose-6-phosphate isomerase-like protein (cupin superfamily)